MKKINIMSYFLILHLDKKKFDFSFFLSKVFLNSISLHISQLARNRINCNSTMKINSLEKTIKKKNNNIAIDEIVLTINTFSLITTKPSFSINVVF